MIMHAWEKVAQKQQPDEDGFWTDYTWYYDPLSNSHIFIFGDAEIYGPEDTPDWECNSWEEAKEWWENYKGMEDY